MKYIQGSGFIEILVSFILIALILLGLDATLLASLRETKNAYYLSIARQQISTFSNFLDQYHEEGFTIFFERWNEENREVLPMGEGVFNGNVLSILWGKQINKNCQQNQMGMSGCLKVELTSRASA